MANIVSSLFGVSPTELQAQKDAAFQQSNMLFSSLNPAQQAVYTAGNLGYGAGKIGGQLFGIEDPMLKQAKEFESVLNQVQGSLSPEDLNDPTKVYPVLIKQLNDKGFTQQANAAMKEYQAAYGDFAKLGGELSLKKAQAGEATAKGLAALQEKLSPYERLVNAYENATGEAKLLIKQKLDKETEKNMPSIDEQIVALSSKKAAGSITKAEEQQLDYLDNFKQKVAKAGASVTNISTKLEESAAKKVGDVLDAGLSSANQAVNTINSVSDIRKAISSGKVIVGPGATLRKTLSQVAQVYAGGSNETQLANTRQAVQGLANLALNARSRLQGSGAISNYEQQTVEKATSGAIEDLTIPEIKVLLDVVERDAKSSYEDYTTKLQAVKDPDLQTIFKPKAMPNTNATMDDLVKKYTK